MDRNRVSTGVSKDKLRKARAIAVKAAHRFGKRPDELAEFFGVSRSTVYNHVGARVFRDVLTRF